MSKAILLELNEVNFDFVRRYIDLGELPNLARLIDRHGITETESEAAYENLEPWIQWVTAHTGKSFAEHGVFRLGDIVDRPDVSQIWEELEAKGVSVGAVSPMNAANRCIAPAFFVPDPWTQTKVIGPAHLARLYKAVCALVNENAGGDAGLKPKLWLIEGLVRYASPSRYPIYARLIAQSTSKSWLRALVLDVLLAEVFIKSVSKTNVDFATVFMNAAAHIQHHYMFNSKVYSGDVGNPEWYIDRKFDPLLDVYRIYDSIVADLIRKFPDRRIMIATGLHQDPYPIEKFYWRLKDHAAFLQMIGVDCVRVEPRMSRDFVVFCADAMHARTAEARLASAMASDGRPLFSVDNRGDSLFVELCYPANVTAESAVRIGNQEWPALRDHVNFVAIKNGEHNGIGYLIDTAVRSESAELRIPLGALHSRLLEYFDVGNGNAHQQAFAAVH